MDARAELTELSVRQLIDRLGVVEDEIRAKRTAPSPAQTDYFDTGTDDVADLVRTEQRIAYELRRRRGRNRPLLTWYHNHRPVAP